MGLSGNLRTIPVPELLQLLAAGPATGTLIVSNGVVERRIYFRGGQLIAAASSDPREYLGHFLVSHGFITEAQLSAAMTQQELTRVMLGKILVDKGHISVDDLESMLELKSREGIYDLFTWRDGEFRFIDGQLPDYEMVPLSIGVTNLILDAMVRIDEWNAIRKLIPSVDTVPVMVGGPLDASDVSPGERTVIAAVDDDRSVAEICLHTHSSEYFVSNVLLRLVETGRLKLVRPRRLEASDLLKAADSTALAAQAWKHFETGDYQHAMRHARAAATLEPDNAEVRKDVMRLEQALRERLDAEGVKPDKVPRVLVQTAELTALNLSPEEGFVLTRIDGRSTVGAILKVTPVAILDAMLVFHRLLLAGHIKLDPLDEARPGPGQGVVTSMRTGRSPSR